MSEEGPFRRFLGRRRLFATPQPESSSFDAEALKAQKREEWINQGYPPELIETAFDWVDRWVIGTAVSITGGESVNPDLYRKVVESAYPRTLDKAKNWMDSVLE